MKTKTCCICGAPTEEIGSNSVLVNRVADIVEAELDIQVLLGVQVFYFTLQTELDLCAAGIMLDRKRILSSQPSYAQIALKCVLPFIGYMAPGYTDKQQQQARQILNDSDEVVYLPGGYDGKNVVDCQKLGMNRADIVVLFANRGGQLSTPLIEAAVNSEAELHIVSPATKDFLLQFTDEIKEQIDEPATASPDWKQLKARARVDGAKLLQEEGSQLLHGKTAFDMDGTYGYGNSLVLARQMAADRSYNTMCRKLAMQYVETEPRLQKLEIEQANLDNERDVLALRRINQERAALLAQLLAPDAVDPREYEVFNFRELI